MDVKTQLKNGGRPRSFDRQLALETAMRLFWRHGYEGVTIGDLTSAIGVAPPSLYASFGNKEQLYRESLALYEECSRVFDLSGFKTAATPKQAVQIMLMSATDSLTKIGRERGCMISSGLVDVGIKHRAIGLLVAQRRRVLREKLSSNLQRWFTKADAAPIARYLSAILQGMSVQARDGATVAELRMIIRFASDSIPAGKLTK
jgi:AcrR family transcriptional regulator